MNSKDNRIITLSQYGNVLVNSRDVGIARGSGNWNPPDRFEQSTNRGNAYMNAYPMFNKENKEFPEPSDSENLNSIGYNLSDDLRKRAYVVGSTGLHSETASWNRSEPDGIQGENNKYVEWALKSAAPGGMTATPILVYFFSTDNVNYLQNRIKSEVKKHSGHDINNQSIDELLIIMRANLLYAYSGWLPNENNPDKITDRGEKKYSLEDRLTRLNKSVIEEGVKQVLSGINMYNKYLLDKSSLPMPLSMPVYTSMSGSRELMPPIGFNSGLEKTIAAQSFNQRFNII